jgi:hypothetical protein
MFTLISLLGIFDMLLAIYYSIYMQKNIAPRINKIFYLFQVVLVPILLFLCGFILFLLGWRLGTGSLFFFIYLLLNSFLIYICVKDFIIFKKISSSKEELIGESGFAFRLLFTLILLLLPNLIFMAQGWQLDPLLRIGFLLLIVLVIYLSIKDFLFLK